MFRRIALLLIVAVPVFAQRTEKPPLHGSHWMAVTGKPLAATAGAMIFQKGGNAVDAAAAMIAAAASTRSEEHTSELQSRSDLVCRHLLGKKKASGRLL